MTSKDTRPPGLAAIEREMARQSADALASFAAARAGAAAIAASIARTGRLLMLGMGGSHAVGRMLEPIYRARGIDAVALPLSEQLGAPLPTAGRTVVVTSQSGESAEVLRWLAEGQAAADSFGLTLEGGSILARSLPSLVGAGGTEVAFAATRSITITVAQHLAVLAALGADPAAALSAIGDPPRASVEAAVAALDDATVVVTSGRRLQGLAEAIALGLTELARLPAFALEGGQLRHGPLEMLGGNVGVVLFRAAEPASPLVASLAATAVGAGSPVVVFDASGEPPVAGATTVAVPAASGLAAVFSLLPNAQAFAVAFATRRVADVGTPRRSTKITRTE
jgi:fructoselysine-6-P-deglycase FrlB-like protein